MIKDISLIRRIEEAHRRLEELSTLGNNTPGGEIEIRRTVDVVSDLLNEVKTLVTDAKRAGNCDYENEIPFSVLAEAAADAILSIDDQSTIRYVNPAAGRMFGYEPVEMVGKNLTCLMPEHLRQIHLVNREYERQFHVQRDQIRGKTANDIHPRHVAESVQANDRQVIEAGSPIQYEVAIPTAEGERHYVVVKFLLQGYEQKPYAICGIATDITELKRAEELQARRARQAALRADIHAAFSVGTEGALPTMLQRSAEAIVRHLDAAFARVWTFDDRQNVLELQASAGLYTRLDGEHARVAVGNLKRLLRNVPEGQYDRSLARSAWGNATPKSRPEGYGMIRIGCARRFDVITQW